MSEQELVEALAEKEHASWARWMDYLFSKCVNPTHDGSLVIPGAFARHWWTGANTAYADLPEHIKQLDREEVAHILPIIQQYTSEWQRSEADGT